MDLNYSIISFAFRFGLVNSINTLLGLKFVLWEGGCFSLKCLLILLSISEYDLYFRLNQFKLGFSKQNIFLNLFVCVVNSQNILLS